MLSERVNALSQNAVQTIELIHSITDRVSGFHEQVDEQNIVVQETTAAIDEMSTSLDSVADITANRKESAEGLLNIAEVK